MVTKVPPPVGSTLAAYLDKAGYVDCYKAELSVTVTQKQFVAAFYRTPLFRLEALILAVAARRPSTKAQAGALARGEVATFAAWDVETRDTDALLLCDMSGHTRSWLSVPRGQGTTILFGSIVMGDKNGRLGPLVWGLLPFHKIYAKALLWSAARALQR